jgi:hypothetical protein
MDSQSTNPSHLNCGLHLSRQSWSKGFNHDREVISFFFGHKHHSITDAPTRPANKSKQVTQVPLPVPKMGCPEKHKI